MTVGITPTRLLRWISKYWKVMLPAAAGAMATIGTFWFPPPESLTDESKSYISFARFVVAVLLGIMILPLVTWTRRRHARLWGGIAAATLICGIVAFFSYQSLNLEWTAPYGGKIVLVGSELTGWAAKFRDAHPAEATSEALLESAAGDPKRVWTERSLKRRRLVLSAAYVLFAPFFAVAIIAVAQVAFCVRTEKRRNTRAGRTSAANGNPPSDGPARIPRRAVAKKPREVA